MPEPGQITGDQAAALTGLAPSTHNSRAMRGKRAIGGGRRLLRHVMFQAALVASYHTPVLNLRRSIAQSVQAAQGRHHGCRKKACYNRKRALQTSPQPEC